MYKMFLKQKCLSSTKFPLGHLKIREKSLGKNIFCIIQGVYINCQKLKSLLRGKYQLNIVYFGKFVLHISSHLSTTCKIPPTMKKKV